VVSKEDLMFDDSLLQKTKRLLGKAEVRAKKSLGQHFLIDRDVLRRIVDAAEIDSSDTVVEVGPGLGVLTEELAKYARNVIAIEIDDTLAPMLRTTLFPKENVCVVHGDILSQSLSELLPQGTKDYKVVANLPYYITSPVIRFFLDSESQPKSIVVMIQKEVAQAIAAEPGEMSLLSVAVQLYGIPRVICTVSASCFYPVPKVESAVLKIEVLPEPLIAHCFSGEFFALVRAGFCANRKQLQNSLTQGLACDKSSALLLLDEAGIDGSRRAETLSVSEWVKMWKVFSKRGRK